MSSLPTTTQFTIAIQNLRIHQMIVQFLHRVFFLFLRLNHVCWFLIHNIDFLSSSALLLLRSKYCKWKQKIILNTFLKRNYGKVFSYILFLNLNAISVLQIDIRTILQKFYNEYYNKSYKNTETTFLKLIKVLFEFNRFFHIA